MLSDLLHNIARLKAETEEEAQAFRYRPSNAGPEKCIRALTYARTGTTPSKRLQGRAYHVFMDGHIHALLVADYIALSNFGIHSQEMPVVCWSDNELVLKGSLDGIFTDPLGRDRVLELKALNHFTWGRYNDGVTLPEDYIVQTCCYIRGARELNPAIDEGVLLLKNKNTAQYVEFLLRYDPDFDTCSIVSLTRGTGETIPINQVRLGIVGAAVAKFKAVEAYAQAGTLPDRPIEFLPGEYPCSYCPWEDECWKNFAEQTQRGGEVVLSAETNAEVFAGQYIVLQQRAKQAESDKATHRDKLLTILRANQAIKAKAGRFIITRSVSQRPGRLDEEALDAITKQRIAAARGTPIVVEVLRVRDPITTDLETREEGI